MTNDTKTTLEFLQHQHTSGSRAWKALCLKLTRTARVIPARYPSAVAAQLATPKEDRVYDMNKVTAGMVMYFDDPNDSNPFGHICTAAYRSKDGRARTWTNDARVPGGVDLVDASFFPKYWGDSFQFAATSLNGYDLLLPKPKPSEKVPPLRDKGAKKINHMIDELEGMIDHQKAQGHTRLVKALQRDVDHLKNILTRFN